MMATSKLLSKLRILMKDVSLLEGRTIQAYIIPSSDAHGSEYLCERDKRRQFISGFTGSAGTALVTNENALLWTDGRYFLQASQQLDSNWKLMKEGLEETPSLSAWLIKNMPPSSIIGVDATLYEEELYLNLESSLKNSNLTLLHVNRNLIDVIWSDEQPKLELKPLLKVQLDHCGKSTKDKLKQLRDNMNAKNVYSIVVTALDDIAWLLNLRSSDIPYNMVFFSYLIITKTSLKLFIHQNRLNNDIKSYLRNEEEYIQFYEYDEFYKIFEEFYKNEYLNYIKEQEKNNQQIEKIWLTPNSNHAIHSIVNYKHRHLEASFINRLKVIKNKQEIEASKQVHIKDSAALCEFFYWIETKIEEKAYDNEEFNEYNVGKYIDSLRMNEYGCIKPSFETICSTGSNGSIIHYKPEKNKCKQIEINNLLLLDSGGHYIEGGTTDVTRTVFLGDKNLISEHQKECFTRVLKGHIQLAIKIFPSNIRAELMDSFARQSLWQIGLDYRHGTGHGVGHINGVHELPIMGSRKISDIGIQQNMIITIEPGYYEDNKFGIRIENCQQTVEAKTKYNHDNRKFITFQPLTYVPLQRELINKDLLEANEIEWINNYHNKCLQYVGEILKQMNKKNVYDWLVDMTKPL